MGKTLKHWKQKRLIELIKDPEQLPNHIISERLGVASSTVSIYRKHIKEGKV